MKSYRRPSSRRRSRTLSQPLMSFLQHGRQYASENEAGRLALNGSNQWKGRRPSEKMAEGVGGQRGGRFRIVELPAPDLVARHRPVCALYLPPRNVGKKPSNVHGASRGGANAPKASRTARASSVNAPCAHFRQASFPSRNGIRSNVLGKARTRGDIDSASSIFDFANRVSFLLISATKLHPSKPR